jgi:hypothetical protein
MHGIHFAIRWMWEGDSASNPEPEDLPAATMGRPRDQDAAACAV